MKKIILPGGLFTLVDDDDYEYLSKFKWNARRQHDTYYVISSKRVNHKQITLHMHRMILNIGYGDKRHVDHINNIAYDNRKCNLRICTRSQQSMNRRKLKQNQTSIYKGVYLKKGTKTYVATIYLNKQTFFLGGFKSEIEAAKAYDKKAIEMFGEFANLNFKQNEHN